MIKELDLQISTCSSVLKLNIDPLHFQRAYFVHFETNWMIFATLDALGGGLQNPFKL